MDGSKKIDALITPEEIERHRLMILEQRDYVENIKKEFEIDKELGLSNQMNLDQRDLLQKDINELTNSNDFYEINKSHLNNLFSINLLKLKCLPYNIKETIKKTWNYFGKNILSLILFVGLLISSVEFCYSYKSSQLELNTAIYTIILNIILFVLCGFSFIGIFLPYFKTKLEGKEIRIDDYNTKKIYTFNFRFMDVRLKMQELNKTKMKIPYGAKLKTLEAKKTGIFEDFVIAYPEIFIKDFDIHHTEIIQKSIDPAILGVTADKRMFMIVYWDIKNDVEKAIKDIKHLKRFKLNDNL